MDDDLTTRRFRPPSQPARDNGQPPIQAPSPWGVPFTPDGHHFAPPDGPSGFDGPFAPPGPTNREDVPWDRPEPDPWPPADLDANGFGYEQSHDPDDALAPVVSDAALAPAQPAWLSTGGDSHVLAGVPEPMKVAAHDDGPLDFDESPPASWGEPVSPPSSSGSSAGGGRVDGDPVPEWPAEDDLNVVPPMRTESPDAAETPPEPAMEAAAAPESPSASAPESERQGEPPQTTPEPAAPAVATVVIPAGANPMVLRIEVAIVDDGRHASGTDAAKRDGADADVRRSEYGPRNQGGRARMLEPEYVWDVPPHGPDEPEERPHKPAAPLPPEPMTIDWELPAVGAAQPMPDPLAPWSTPSSVRPPHQEPVQAPAPTWGLTQPAPSNEPPAPQYRPPTAPVQQLPAAPQQPVQPAWAPSRPEWPPSPPAGHDPLGALTLTPYATEQKPLQSLQSTPAPGSGALTDTIEDDAQPEGRTSSIWTAVLTIGFALLVLVLVLVVIQLTTLLLR